MRWIWHPATLGVVLGLVIGPVVAVGVIVVLGPVVGTTGMAQSFDAATGAPSFKPSPPVGQPALGTAQGRGADTQATSPAQAGEMTTSTSAASKVDVHTRPNANQVAVGEIIEVQVRLANPDALPIDAVELLLQFDPAVLQVVDTAGQPATKVDASAIAVAWQVPLQNSVDNERGQVSLAFGADLAGAAVDGDELHVATLRLHAIAPSTSTALAWLRTEIASRGNSVPPRPLRSR